MTTKHRAVAVATTAFAERGVAGTSLDWLAAELGVTKQTILYHFGSKDGLIAEVLATGARDLAAALDTARDPGLVGFERVEALVRASFALAVARPDLLGLLRELNRLGPTRSGAVLDVLQPLIDEAIAFLTSEMTAGRFRAGDPEMVLVSAYAVVTGAVADTEVLRAVGLDLDLRVAVRLRRTLLSFLEAVLVGERGQVPIR